MMVKHVGGVGREVKANRTGGMEDLGREGELRKEDEEAAGGRSKLEKAEVFKGDGGCGISVVSALILCRLRYDSLLLPLKTGVQYPLSLLDF